MQSFDTSFRTIAEEHMEAYKKAEEEKQAQETQNKTEEVVESGEE